MAKMKSIKLAIFLAILISMPIALWFYGYATFAYYDALAEKYDCYPVETCRWDINGDGVSDAVKVLDEPKLDEKYHQRLKLFVFGDEVLNIENVHVDNSFRTHLASLNEKGTAKIIIYDNVNPIQFYYWNGSALVPDTNPSELAKEIRTAMGYQDDTGGFNSKLTFYFGGALLCAAFYVCLGIAVLAYFYYRPRKLP